MTMMVIFPEVALQGTMYTIALKGTSEIGVAMNLMYTAASAQEFAFALL